jgi:hypothetical protein
MNTIADAEDSASIPAPADEPGDSTPGVGAMQRNRALIGWMPEEHGGALLAGGDPTGAQRPDLVRRVRAARATVAARPADADQTDVVEVGGDGLGSTQARLVEQPELQTYWNEGWQLGVADLSRICAVQPTVAVEHARARVAAVDPADIASIADVTLPRPTANQVPAQFDSARGVWIISSANPNLRIISPFGGPVQEGLPPGFGFCVTVLPSFVQVARHHGRWVLRDGYHRAVGLLERGITRAPVLVRDFELGDLGLGPGLLPSDVYLGDRPPFLSDFLDDSVAADIQTPATQKMIVVQALELSPMVSGIGR